MKKMLLILCLSILCSNCGSDADIQTENKNATENKVILLDNTKKINIEKVQNNIPPLQIGKDRIIGPFVTINEFEGVSYANITAFFDNEAISFSNQLSVTSYINNGMLNITVTAKEETNINANNQSLWSVVYGLDKKELAGTKKINVVIDFNSAVYTQKGTIKNKLLREPTRGTLVIPPTK
ncbi:hypothetical protein [Tenacibaculum halocynthiae]|uniref:hypothetical protein n=1 Tax=Tenacibaculum halocynthiae TaxID=1254437 RepID=UPI0038937744